MSDSSNTPVGQATKSASSPQEPDSDDFTRFKKYIDKRFDSFKDTLLKEVRSTLKELNKSVTEKSTSVEASITHFSTQYDNLIQKVTNTEKQVVTVTAKQEQLTKETETIKAQISLLQAKIDDIDQRNRSCNIEIRNIPEEKGEQLLNIIKNIYAIFNKQMDKEEIYTAFRTGKGLNAPSKTRPIIVIFKSFYARSNFLRYAKEYNKNCKEPGMRLKTDFLNLNLVSQPFFVSEHLTARTKMLLSKTKQVAKERDYKYCWHANGKILIKKSDSTKPVLISSEDCLLNL